MILLTTNRKETTAENINYMNITTTEMDATDLVSNYESSMNNTETEIMLEGIPSYESVWSFPDDMMYASPEALEMLSKMYSELEFSGQYMEGDRSDYDYYRKKFAQLLEGEVEIYDSEGNESLIKNSYDLDEYGITGYERAGCKYYFFDMDEITYQN